MKKTALLLSIIFLSVTNCYPQYLRPLKKKKFSMDIGVEQSFMTTSWYGDNTYDELIKSIGGTSVFIKFNLKVYKDFGCWTAMEYIIRGKELGISDKPAILDNLDFNYNNYYVRKMGEFSPSNIVDPKLSFGFFYEFERNKWSFSPAMGIGLHYTDYSHLSYRIKEKDTNQTYLTSFEHKIDGASDYSLTYLALQLKANYKLAKKARLMLGLNFNQYVNRCNFSTSISDYYDGTSIYKAETKSRLVNTLGISAGISF